MHNSFLDLETTKMGTFGEKIVSEELKKTGYSVFHADHTGPHPIDFFVFKDGHSFFCDVKTKARLNNFNATGIDIKHYKIYHEIAKKHKVALFFVDEMLGKIYYGNINDLDETCNINNIKFPNTNIVNNIILFPLEKMKTLRELSKKEVEKIKIHSTRNYKYENKFLEI